MLKVMTIVGTRPEVIRLSRVIEKFDAAFDHTLVHTGQNFDYELNEIFFNQLGIRAPDQFLEAAGKTAAETIGKVIIAADTVLEKYAPDALLILRGYKQLSCRNFGQTPEDPNFSYGGRQSLFRFSCT